MESKIFKYGKYIYTKITCFRSQILLHEDKVEQIEVHSNTYLLLLLTETFGWNIYTFLIYFHTAFIIMAKSILRNSRDRRNPRETIISFLC